MKNIYRIFTTIILSGLILSCQEKEIFQEIQTDNNIGVFGDKIKGVHVKDGDYPDGNFREIGKR